MRVTTLCRSFQVEQGLGTCDSTLGTLKRSGREASAGENPLGCRYRDGGLNRVSRASAAPNLMTVPAVYDSRLGRQLVRAALAASEAGRL